MLTLFLGKWPNRGRIGSMHLLLFIGEGILDLICLQLVHAVLFRFPQSAQFILLPFP